MCLDTFFPTTRPNSKWIWKAVDEERVYSKAVKQQLKSGTRLDDVEVDFRLSVLKPLHAQWLVKMYNFFTTERGKGVISKGWKKARLSGLLDGTTGMSPEDPLYTLQFL